MSRAQNTSSDTLDAAVAWHVRLSADDMDEQDLSEFAAWLESDSANRAAFARVSGADLTLQALAEQSAPPGCALDDLPFVRVQRFAGSRRGWMAAGGLLAACALVAVLIFRPGGGATPTVYATAVGQLQTVTLSDGSTVTLNTATHLTVATDGDVRHVRLDTGEALFTVAKDQTHPFLVMAASRVVRVVGTVFDVRRDGGNVAVVVARGKVAVGPKRGTGGMTYLSPGDRLTYVAAANSTALDRVDPTNAISWQNGYLIYENAPLSQVVVDLNRYFRSPVAIADSKTADLRFSGVLKVDDEAAILHRLTQFLPLTVESQEGGRLVLHASGKRD